MIDSVEQELLPLRADWQANADPLSDEVRVAMFQWAWTHSELREAVKECFRLDENDNVESIKDRFFDVARLWMTGMRFREIAEHLTLPMDDLLAVHSRGLTFSLQTLVEQ